MFSVPSTFCPWVGSSGGGGLGGGTSGGGTWPVPTCYQRIASSSPATVEGMCGAVSCGGAGDACGSLSVLKAARPWRLSMSLLSSSAGRLARASRLTPRVAIVGSCLSARSGLFLAVLIFALQLHGDWITVLLSGYRLMVVGVRVITIIKNKNNNKYSSLVLKLLSL